MSFIKKGHLFNVLGDKPWSRSHAQVPFAYEMPDSGLIRIFYATRDENSCSSTTFIDVERENPELIVYKHDKPVLQKGNVGDFDDSGTMPSWIVEHEGKLLLYYTAWNKSSTVSYRLSIGLAISEDGGLTFNKPYAGPLMDRGMHDPIWVGQPCVIKEGNIWKMWYLSCQKTEVINGIAEPFYNVKYAESQDGVHWNRKDVVCIDFDHETDAIGRPCVWKEDGLYKMLHSNRHANGYRTEQSKGYRIEYSESEDGLNWKSRKDKLNFEKSDQGWDSIMNEYCTVFRNENGLQMIYNGNGFGNTGFGWATLNNL